KYPDLIAHVWQHRTELLSAALVMLSAFCAAGRPAVKLPALGRFEGWTGLVRQTIVWCGLPDPGEARYLIKDVADDTIDVLKAILDGLDYLDKNGEGLTVSQIRRQADSLLNRDQQQLADLCEALRSGCNHHEEGLPNTMSIGYLFRRLRG